MKARYLKSDTLEQLKKNIAENLPLYRSGDFSELMVDTSSWLEMNIDIDDQKLLTLIPPKGEDLYEIENCLIVSEALADLTPYAARDERFWAYLTHTFMLEYTRKRWPIPENDDEALIFIQNHFFAKDKRQIERGHAISRLWWMAYLCKRVPSLKMETSLQAFLYRSDVRASIIERPTMSQSIPLFTALLKKLAQSFDGGKVLFERDIFRKLMREINSIGGSKLLDCLEAAHVEKIVDEIIHTNLQVKAL